MKVVIIGTGNVATVLGKKIMNAGHEIIQVAGRTTEKSDLLATQFHATPVYNICDLNLSADIYIIAVSDSAVHSVATNLKLTDKIVVHTAAAVSKNALTGCSENFGVLYPLQTLSKELTSLPSVPVLIDGSNEITKEVLIKFSSGWAEYVQIANDEERLKLHVAAVFVNNFTNYIFTIMEDYCKKEQLKFNILYPLIEETITKLKFHSPSAVQTGPAVREDFVTIAKHKQVLRNHPVLQNLYTLLTDRIISFNAKNKTPGDNKQTFL